MVETTESGSSGLFQFGGIVSDEKLQQLNTPERRNRVYREMADNDPVCGAMLFVVDMLIRQLEWEARPFEEGVAADEEVARFVNSCIDDMNKPFHEVVSEVLSFLIYGWSWHEVVFKRRMGRLDEDFGVDNATILSPNRVSPDNPSSRFDDGLWGWHKIAGRAQETLDRWVFDGNGELLGMVQRAPPQYAEKPIAVQNSLHFRTTMVRNNPEGRSIFRNAYRPWYFKKTIEEIQAVGIERDLTGLPVMWVPDEIMQADAPAQAVALRNQLESMIRNIRRGHQEGLLIPLEYNQGGQKMYDFSLVHTGGTRQMDTGKVLEYYDRRIAGAALIDFITMGHESVGSFALADSKTDMFGVALGAWVKVIADQFNDKAIPQLLRINGMDESRAPELVHSDLESMDLDTLGQFIDRLAGAGATLFPDDELQSQLLDEANLISGSREEL